MMSTPARPRVILHVGIPKTGTSALQVAFVRDRELLAQNGIIYPSDPAAPSMDARATRGGVTSGNASRLRNFLRPSETPPGVSPEQALARVVDLVQRSGDGTSSLLFSSEFLCRSEMERFATFAAACDDLGYDIQVAGYVRDIASHAFSAYVQQVKRNSYKHTFSKYIEPGKGNTYRPELRSWIEGTRKILGDEAVTVFHYDSLRGDLVKQFFEDFLAVPADNLTPALEHTVNRSLTPSEVTLMREINQHLDRSTKSRVVSDLMISRPPVVPEKPFITQAERDRLTELFSEEVDWINANGIRGGKLQVDSPDVEVRAVAQEQTPITPGEQTLIPVLAKLADASAAQRGSVKKRSPKKAPAQKAPAQKAPTEQGPVAAAPSPAPRRGFFRRK